MEQGIAFSNFQATAVRVPAHTIYKYSADWDCKMCGERGSVEGNADELHKKIVEHHKSKSPSCAAILVGDIPRG